MFLNVLAQAILYLFELAQVMTTQDFKMAKCFCKGTSSKRGSYIGFAVCDWVQIL